MAPDRQEIIRLGDKLDEAFTLFCDGERSGEAFVFATDYRDEGYELAVSAFATDEPEAFIEAALDDSKASEDARYLIACAAAFRLAELRWEAVREAA